MQQQALEILRDYGRTLVEALVGCCFLVATWAANRTKRWLLELVDRERQRGDEQLSKMRAEEMQRHNETVRTVSEASASAAQPTLESLLGNADRDFSIEAGKRTLDPVAPERRSPPPPVPLSPAGSAPQRVVSLVSWPSQPDPAPLTWDDEDEATEIPIRSSRPPPERST